MTNIYISNISHVNEYEDRVKIIGKPKYNYHVEVEKVEKLLIDYLSELNKFPVYLTITTYHDYEEFEASLKRLNQEYQVDLLANVVYTSTEDGGVLTYNVPIIKVKIINAASFKSIIYNSFWMAESNCTYVLSFTDNVSFKNEAGKDWRGKETELSTILIDMCQETTTLVITHDAHGFLLFSNLEEYNSAEMMAKQLPSYTTVLSVE